MARAILESALVVWEAVRVLWVGIGGRGAGLGCGLVRCFLLLLACGGVTGICDLLCRYFERGKMPNSLLPFCPPHSRQNLLERLLNGA